MMLILVLLLSIGFLLSVVVGGRLIMLLRRFTPRDLPPLTDNSHALPTVSVCIPARNETHAMTQCLERVIATTYPKLEIIVLDDDSTDNTSVLIKSFAHAGVRFVEGSPLPEGWLGKNHAQQDLYLEASGEYILFLDVDTQLSPHSIDRLIATILSEDMHMVAVLPTRHDVWRLSVVFATLRHFWSVITHTKRHPSVTSSAWLVKKALLTASFDGFRQLAATVSPESVVARTASRNHRYRFYMGTQALGISYEKKWQSQCETSIRLLYPFFGGRLLTASAGFALLAVAVIPFIVLPFALASGQFAISLVAAVAAFGFLIDYMLYISRVWHRGWLLGGLLFPVIVLQEIVLLLQSIRAYATHTVTWKGRPIRSTARQASAIVTRD